MLREMGLFGQGGTSRRNDPEGFAAWQAQRAAAAQPSTAAPGAPTAFQQSLQQPFVPEQAPAMLPMQAGMPQQMPANIGSGKGPIAQQMPMQASPTGASTGKPVDINAMIQQLMSSGLLGGL